MSNQRKNTRHQPSTLGSGLSKSKQKALKKLGKENQSKMEAAWQRQRSKTEATLVRRQVKKPIPMKTELPPITKFKSWEFPVDMYCRDPVPLPNDDFDCSELETILNLGEESNGDSATDELNINLGIDFGTSSTKVVARFPYEPGQPTIAIPAPLPCRVLDNPHLWRTVLWLKDDGSIFMWPIEDSTVFDTLKQDLVVGRVNSSRFRESAVERVHHEQTATAYLAYVIRYVRGWLRKNQAQAFRNRSPVWRYNIGMPTDSYDKPMIAELYRRVAAAAVVLADLGLPIAADSTELTLNDSQTIQAGQSIEFTEEAGIAVVPEAAAEMTSFAKSERRAEGLYMMIDVGAMTLDVTTFTLHANQQQGKDPIYSFMAANIQPLGVESCYWFQNRGKSKDDFSQQCKHTLTWVIESTKKSRVPDSDRWEPGERFPIFLAGGGANHHLHRTIVESLDSWMKQYTRNDGIRLAPPEPPKTLDGAGFNLDYGRMGVAWGLSFDFSEIGEIHSVSQTEDVKIKERKKLRDIYPGSEVM